MIRTIAAVAATLCVAVPSWAADTCTGHDILVTQLADTTDLGHGLKQITVKQYSIVMSNDSIYNLAAGECSGTILLGDEGKTQFVGYCARRDKDGDTVSLSFHQSPGSDKGEWKIVSGTGKFAGKQDTGWFQNELTDGKMGVTKWGGDCKK
jgi:hypothetical protein